MNSDDRALPTPTRNVLPAALLLGLAADLLLRATPWGVGLGLWSALGLAVLMALAYRERVEIPTAAWPCLGFGGLCGLLAAGRGSEVLLGLTLAVGTGSLLLAVWASHGGRHDAASLTDIAAKTVVHALFSGLGLLAWIGEPLGRPRKAAPGTAATLARVLVGIAAAAPLLVLFTLLFSSADAVFASAVKSVFRFDLPTLFSHVFIIGVGTWFCAGYGRRFLSGLGAPPPKTLSPNPPETAPDVEVLTSLGLVTALFLAFVGVQVRYLFGDDALVQSTTGLTYAEYARHGFFELLAAVGLVIPVLLLGDWLLGNSKQRRGFQVVAGALLLLVGLVVFSAWRRLGLYTSAYGLTEPRLYAAAALVWLTAVSVWLLVCVLPGRRGWFCAGAFVSAVLVVLGLHALNPDALIARRNVLHARAGGNFDADHALHLGPDAVPILLANLDLVPAAERDGFVHHLRRRFLPDAASPDWRTWNLARERAAEALRAATH